MRRRLPLALVVAALAMGSFARPAVAATDPPATAALPKPKADIVVDAATGRPLVCDNVHEAIHPASTSKIMTALVAVERLAPNANVTVDAAATGVETNKMGFPVGMKLPLDKMLASLMMMSANDAAYAIAHTVSGSLDGFSVALNDTARRLGLKDSRLNDPAGLDDTTSFNGGPYMSAYDLALATRNALSVPAIARWASTRLYDFTVPSGPHYYLKNHNRMLAGGGYDYPGSTGFKTGYTDRAQHSLVATATRNGRTLIAVVLGAVTPGYTEAAGLLDAGFAAPADAPAPPTCGTDVLPAPRVSLYASRAADRDAFGGLGKQTPAASTPPTASGPTPAAARAPVVPAQIEPLASAPVAPAPVKAAAVVKPNSGGFVSTRNAVVIMILLLFGAIAVRRRAVRRERARRAARRRQRAAAMRSGGLPVVDGKYRAGTRVGPPVESHVRVRRIDDRQNARSRSG